MIGMGLGMVFAVAAPVHLLLGTRHSLDGTAHLTTRIAPHNLHSAGLADSGCMGLGSLDAEAAVEAGRTVHPDSTTWLVFPRALL